MHPNPIPHVLFVVSPACASSLSAFTHGRSTIGHTRFNSRTRLEPVSIRVLHSRPTPLTPKMTEAAAPSRRVLSIQSHVVSGHVGNSAAVFPLRLLGYDVDSLPSCVLSNHSAYAHGAPGIHLDAPDAHALLGGLRANGLLGDATTHVLTGYIGRPGFLRAVAETVTDLKKAGGVTYVCDPVLGDNGRLYVPAEVVGAYAEYVLPCADVITPNIYELALLHGSSDNVPDTEQQVFAACDELHSRFPNIRTIFVTGARPAGSDADTVSVLVSSWNSNEDKDEKVDRFAVDARLLKGHFTGTGDLLSAMLLAWTDSLDGDLRSACQHAVAAVHGVLHRTVEMPKSGGECPFYELRLVQSQDLIKKPPLHLVSLRAIE